jgi:hypothetical protein
MIRQSNIKDSTTKSKKAGKIAQSTEKSTVSNTFELCIKGKVLYDRINCVVTLDENMRHSINRRWVAILDRWRLGDHRQEDFDYVNNECFYRQQEELNDNDPDRRTFCPIISASNALVQQYNSACTVKYAIATGQPIYRLFALSKGKRRIRPRDLSYLRSLPPSSTSKVSLTLDCVIGMPMSCTVNSKNRKLKQANGSIGQLVKIQWAEGTIFHRQGLYTVPSKQPEVLYIKLFGETEVLVKGLPAGVLPIPLPKLNAHINVALRGRSFRTTWSQFQLVPCFSMTVNLLS